MYLDDLVQFEVRIGSDLAFNIFISTTRNTNNNKIQYVGSFVR